MVVAKQGKEEKLVVILRKQLPASVTPASQAVPPQITAPPQKASSVAQAQSGRKRKPKHKPVPATPEPTPKPQPTAQVKSEQVHSSPLPAVAPPTTAPREDIPVPTTSAKKSNAIQKKNKLRTQLARQVSDELTARWPQIFPKHKKRGLRPLALKIHQDLIDRLPEYRPRIVKQGLNYWIFRHRVWYWIVLKNGGPRYDLDGNPRGEVTPDEQAHAARLVSEWRAARQARLRHAILYGKKTKAPQAEPPERVSGSSNSEQEI